MSSLRSRVHNTTVLTQVQVVRVNTAEGDVDYLIILLKITSHRLLGTRQQ